LEVVFKELKENRQDIMEEFSELSQGNLNFMRQNRVCVSPTLTSYMRGQ